MRLFLPPDQLKPLENVRGSTSHEHRSYDLSLDMDLDLFRMIKGFNWTCFTPRLALNDSKLS